MNRTLSSEECPHNARALTAARTGQVDEALEAHAMMCQACGEVARVGGSLRTLALETQDNSPLPDPYLVWLKARLIEQQVASHRASKPWDLVEVVAPCVVGAVSASWLMVESSPSSPVYWTLIGVVSLVTLLVAEPLLSQE